MRKDALLASRARFKPHWLGLLVHSGNRGHFHHCCVLAQAAGGFWSAKMSAASRTRRMDARQAMMMVQ